MDEVTCLESCVVSLNLTERCFFVSGLAKI